MSVSLVRKVRLIVGAAAGILALPLPFCSIFFPPHSFFLFSRHPPSPSSSLSLPPAFPCIACIIALHHCSGWQPNQGQVLVKPWDLWAWIWLIFANNSTKQPRTIWQMSQSPWSFELTQTERLNSPLNLHKLRGWSSNVQVWRRGQIDPVMRRWDNFTSSSYMK